MFFVQLEMLLCRKLRLLSRNNLHLKWRIRNMKLRSLTRYNDLTVKKTKLLKKLYVMNFKKSVEVELQCIFPLWCSFKRCFRISRERDLCFFFFFLQMKWWKKIKKSLEILSQKIIPVCSCALWTTTNKCLCGHFSMNIHIY